MSMVTRYTAGVLECEDFFMVDYNTLFKIL